MGNIFNSNPAWSIGIIAGLFAIIAGHRLSTHRDRKNRFNNAAEKFRNTILSETKGLYPVSSPWPDEKFLPVFKKSIPAIESAAVEIKRLIRHKTAFDIAINDYREYCQKINQGDQAAWELYTSTREELGKPEPRKEFERLVHNLLSFAKEK